MRSLYMIGLLVGAQSSQAPGQSGLADAASAFCPGGDRSSHACSHTRTLKQHIEQISHLNKLEQNSQPGSK